MNLVKIKSEKNGSSVHASAHCRDFLRRHSLVLTFTDMRMCAEIEKIIAEMRSQGFTLGVNFTHCSNIFTHGIKVYHCRVYCPHAADFASAYFILGMHLNLIHQRFAN